MDPLVTETYFDNLGLLPRAIEGDHSSQLSPAAGASGDAGSEGDYESVTIKLCQSAYVQELCKLKN